MPRSVRWSYRAEEPLATSSRGRGVTLPHISLAPDLLEARFGIVPELTTRQQAVPLCDCEREGDYVPTVLLLISCSSYTRVVAERLT